MFQHLDRLPADAILGLMSKYRADPFSQKVDLGVGVYRDLSGNTPVLDCVRRAERLVLDSQSTKSYVAAAGREEFNTAVEELVLGAGHAARRERRARTVQAPGGCGALRVGAELIRAAAPEAAVHVSDPTWGNHIPLLGNSGLKLQRYPYYDPKTHELKFEEMLERLDGAREGDVVLVHACCHNPSGADLDMGQWRRLTELLLRRRLTPFLDLAYQGFGTDLTADAAPVRLVAERLPEALIAISNSKNLGLYRERVGALIVVSQDAARADAVQSHVLQIARGIYSMPPDHGAAIAARIFTDAALREEWIRELALMRARMTDMRISLSAHLRSLTNDGSFDFIETQHGMFSLLGVSTKAVDLLRDKHHIYMTADSRINIAGLMPNNVEFVAEAIAAERFSLRAAALVAERGAEGGHFGGAFLQHGRGARVVQAQPYARRQIGESGLERCEIGREIGHQHRDRNDVAEVRRFGFRSGVILLVADRLRHHFGKVPVLQDRLADRGVPFLDDVGERARVCEQHRMIHGARQHVQLADAMHHAGEHGFIRIDAGAGARQYEGERGHQGTSLPQVIEIGLETLQLVAFTDLRHGEGDRGAAHHVVADAIDGGSKIRDRPAGAIERRRI